MKKGTLMAAVAAVFLVNSFVSAEAATADVLAPAKKPRVKPKAQKPRFGKEADKKRMRRATSPSTSNVAKVRKQCEIDVKTQMREAAEKLCKDPRTASLATECGTPKAHIKGQRPEPHVEACITKTMMEGYTPLPSPTASTITPRSSLAPTPVSSSEPADNAFDASISLPSTPATDDLMPEDSLVSSTAEGVPPAPPSTPADDSLLGGKEPAALEPLDIDAIPASDPTAPACKPCVCPRY